MKTIQLMIPVALGLLGLAMVQVSAIEEPRHPIKDRKAEQFRCVHCNGTGWQGQVRCPFCKGTGNRS